MAQTIFLIGVVLLCTTLFVLDLVETIRTNRVLRRGQANTPTAVIFLVGILLLYGALQYGGLALIPSSQHLIDAIRRHLPSLAVVHPATQQLTWFGWVLVGVAGFYIASFWDYATHRFLSHSKPFWFTHEYHHLPNQLSLIAPGLTMRPFVVAAVFPSLLGTLVTLLFILSVLGYGTLPLLSVLYVVTLVQTVILAVNHSSTTMRQKWLHQVLRYTGITSPQEHEMHHTVDLAGNYGNFTVLWDKLFGTYVDPTNAVNQNHQLGLAYDQDYLGAITLGKVKLSKKAREKLQVDRYCNID